MKHRLLTPGLVFVGLCLLGLGVAWDSLVPSRAYWGAEQAKEYAAAQLEMHTKSHEHHVDAEKEMAAARERFGKISRQLESARGSQKRIGTVLLIAGISLVLSGVGLYLSENRSD